MREIKFEVIITDNKKELNCKFYEWLDVDGWKHSYYKPLVTNGVFHFDELGDGWMGEIIRRQYTGLKDRNGKEIYEGDIVSGGSRVMIVKFEQQACQFWLKWKDNEGINRYEPLTATFGDDKGYMCNHGICVIGNIYENPELLK